MTFSKKYADRVARLRVPSGFLLVLAFALLAEPATASLLAGVPLSAAGLVVRGWAAGHLAKNRMLAISGPYSYIRNPLYAGTLIVAAGLVIASRRLELLALFASVFGLVYLPVIQLEEQHLRSLFPEFDAYSRRVPLLLPNGKRTADPEPFRWALYRTNEEYKALAGYLAGLAWLVWRSLSVNHPGS